MNTKMATRGLGVFFCLVVILLIVQLLFPKPSPVTPIPDSPSAETPVEITRRERKGESAQKATTEVAKPSERATQLQVKAEKPAAVAVSDPDEEFMKKIASLPLDRATLETRLEVGRRIKTSEKERAKLIFSEKKDGKATIAFAVRQASMQEIAAMTKPYKLLLDQQTGSDARHYVDERYQNLFNSYGLTDGSYRLLYAVIPEAAGGDPAEYYSYAASSEQECRDILRQELAPRPPVVIGVPFSDSSRQRLGGTSYGIVPGDWRMDQLVSEELLKPFYQSSHRAN